MRALVCFLLLVAGCGGTEADVHQMNVGSLDGGGAGAVGDACDDNADCASNLCTKEGYDRKPGPVCTYTCDPANPNPKCPNGCNMKGFCRIPS